MATQSSNPYSLPSPLPHNATSSSTRAPQNISTAKAWRNRFNSLATSDTNSTSHNTEAMDEHNGLQTANTNTSTRSRHIPKWYKIRWFKGMADDVKRRAPFYLSDWTDAWDYRVVPATIYMYFANILPALAFSLDMFTKTNMSYGVNEVLLASVLGSVVFAVFAAQPLVIVGVTGPITVFNYTVYDIIVPTGANFFCIYGINWIMVPINALDTRHYQLMQLTSLCHSFLLRYFWILRSIYLPPERYPGPNPSRLG